MNYQKGQAAILLVFILSMFSLLIGLTMVENGFTASILGRKPIGSDKALYAAHSGVEDAANQIKNGIRPNLGIGGSAYEFDVGPNSHVKVTVSGDTENRTITAVGTSGRFVKKAVSKLQYTSVLPGFNYAIQAGDGGIEIENGATINGNINSNADIEGGSSGDKCNGNPALINGIATASGNLLKLNGTGNGVCISENSYAKNYSACYIKKNGFGVPATAACTVKGVYTGNQPIPPTIQLPNLHIAEFQNYVNTRGSIFTGNCIVGGAPDCSNGTGILGNIKVVGNLSLNQSNIKFSGPVWVTGNLTFDKANMQVELTNDVKNLSQMVIVDGKIVVDSNITFIPKNPISPATDKLFLLFASLDPTTSEYCTSSAINIKSNISSVLFYSVNGCTALSAPSGSKTYFGSVVGQKIYIKNSNLTYDSELGRAIFGWTTEGGWQTLSYTVD